MNPAKTATVLDASYPYAYSSSDLLQLIALAPVWLVTQSLLQTTSLARPRIAAVILAMLHTLNLRYVALPANTSHHSLRVSMAQLDVWLPQ